MNERGYRSTPAQRRLYHLSESRKPDSPLNAYVPPGTDQRTTDFVGAVYNALVLRLVEPGWKDRFIFLRSKRA
jgi:hypothetical protein